jgi:hypothetical protein
MDEKRSHVTISHLADSAQIPALSAGMLSRRQSQIGSHLPAGAEAVSVSDESQPCRGRQRPDPRYGEQSLGLRIGQRHGVELFLYDLHRGFESLDFTERQLQRLVEQCRDLGILPCEQIPDSGTHVP